MFLCTMIICNIKKNLIKIWKSQCRYHLFPYTIEFYVSILNPGKGKKPAFYNLSP